MGELAELTEEHKGTSIAWNSRKLTSAIKQLIFFSEVFPKKFQNEFMDELLKE